MKVVKSIIFATSVWTVIFLSGSAQQSPLIVLSSFSLGLLCLTAESPSILAFVVRRFRSGEFQTEFGPKNDNRLSVPISLEAMLCLALIFSVAFSSWPLHLTYRLSRPDFERAARLAGDGQVLKGPISVGAFQAESIEIGNNDVVCIWLRHDGSGRNGFVKTGPGVVGKRFNLFSVIYLDNEWQYIEED